VSEIDKRESDLRGRDHDGRDRRLSLPNFPMQDFPTSRASPGRCRGFYWTYVSLSSPVFSTCLSPMAGDLNIDRTKRCGQKSLSVYFRKEETPSKPVL
jgi:hypothetical protein